MTEKDDGTLPVHSSTSVSSLEETWKVFIQKKRDMKQFSGGKDTSLEYEVRFPEVLEDRMKFERVYDWLLMNGYQPIRPEPDYTLKINYYLTNQLDKDFVKIRSEINATDEVINFCQNNLLPESTVYVMKRNLMTKYRNTEYGFSVSLESETVMNSHDDHVKHIIDNWFSLDKSFRYMNRVSLVHSKYSHVRVDMSVVKSAKKSYGSYELLREKQFSNSALFAQPDNYEIEIEVLLDDPEEGKHAYQSLQRAIRVVCGGIQNTEYPLQRKVIDNVLEGYYKLIHNDKGLAKRGREVSSSDFIGYGSVTLQQINLVGDEDGGEGGGGSSVNVLRDYCVTDKVDGERRLGYVDGHGSFYLIDMNMNVQYTGIDVKSGHSKENFLSTIMDGELVRKKDKDGLVTYVFVVFDLYFHKGVDLRALPFYVDVTADDEEDESTHHQSGSKRRKTVSGEDLVNHRYYHMNMYVNELQEYLVSKVDQSKRKYQLQVTTKTFEFTTKDKTIFDCCTMCLYNQQHDQSTPYTKDGLIFTPMSLGVGLNYHEMAETSTSGEKIGSYNNKFTWNMSLKWKPPKYNTIDFLVRVQQENGEDKIQTFIVNTNELARYKVLTLMVGQKKGSNQKLQDIILKGNYQDFIDSKDDLRQYMAEKFEPTFPRRPKAHVAYVKLDDAGKMWTHDDDGEGNVTKEEVLDNTIIEFKYIADEEIQDELRWVPLRVRKDKTEEHRKKNTRQFGNSFNVANTNWQSIHYPVTQEMLTGKHKLNLTDVHIVTETVYYNRVGRIGKYTKQLRHLHNRIKDFLYAGVMFDQCTLIDYAVGKGGDIAKWRKAKFVLGIDINADNIHNTEDGACARYINFKKDSSNRRYTGREHYKRVYHAFFLQGNSGETFHNGNFVQALRDLSPEDKIKTTNIYQQIMGLVPVTNQWGPLVHTMNHAVAHHQGTAKTYYGFDVGSIQFALHYMCMNKYTFNNFLKNVCDTICLGGYFIGTCYDGHMVNDLYKRTKTDYIAEYSEDDDKHLVWSLRKHYETKPEEEEDNFLPNDETCLGMRISVFQESINQEISEYLVNFTYLDKMLNTYGFEKVNRFPYHKNIGKHDEVSANMPFEYLKDIILPNDNLNNIEKTIMKLNRYFVYKKTRQLNSEQIHRMFTTQDMSSDEIGDPVKVKNDVKLTDWKNTSI